MNGDDTLLTNLVVTICAPLSLDPTATIGSAPQVRVNYRPDLLPPQRFPADHRGDPEFARSAPEQREWLRLLADTDIAFGVPGDSPVGVAELVGAAPRLRWIQGTAAGAGEQIAGAGLAPEVLRDVVVTSAAGIHAVPLAEFAVFGLLALLKDIDLLQQANDVREWRPRWPMRLLAGSRVVLLGLGGIGAEAARLAAAFGATVTGVRRSARGEVPAGVADAVVTTCPGRGRPAG